MDIRQRISSLLIIVLFASCTHEGQMISSFQRAGDFKDSLIYIDYTDSYNNGFIVPSIKQSPSGKLIFRFKIKNTTKNEIPLAYKIYYHNDSYMQMLTVKGKKQYNNLSSENFYGSYQNTNIGFKHTKVLHAGESIEIFDSIAIVGNPRNEVKYFGQTRNSEHITKTHKTVLAKIKEIQNNEEWLNSIRIKAKKNGVDLSTQISNDAIWLIKEDMKGNNRWQRNLRVGNYSFYLVVTPIDALNKIPNYIVDISKPINDTFIDPLYYFQYQKPEVIKVQKLETPIRVIASLPLEKGIYVELKNTDLKTEHFNKYVGHTLDLKQQSPFEFYPNIRRSTDTVWNIPLLSKQFTTEFTLNDYEKYKTTAQKDRKPIQLTNTNSPGETFGYDPNRKRLWFKNPASTKTHLVKENVGIKTRHGLSYGKYTFKIKMAELLNKHQVWSGLTNAIWLISEQGNPNNNRRYVKNQQKGYMPYYGAKKGEERVHEISYSEIDFEIVKASQYWPKSSYKDKKERKDPASNKDKVMVACTNWDMACLEPLDFNIGVDTIQYKKNEFYIHRWDHWYNALTSKTPELDDELFAKTYFYFQIEWKPTEIIWRIGPEKNQLKVVGYMNDKVTNIPNNQMLCVITQEYHYSNWWPDSPFLQENIPFIGEDLDGYLYSLDIE